MKRSIQTLANIAVVACILWMGFEMFFGASLRNVSSKEALRQIHKETTVGTTQEFVSAIYERNKTDRTTIKKDIFSDTWVIGIPFEIGATDPVLYVQFGTDGTVTAVAMRTSDGIYLDPPADYQDKGTLHLPK
jgi:hypothetical protein